ncbi:MAG: hypothetical protein AAF335_03550, partial [Bacteroidota bacterium]
FKKLQKIALLTSLGLASILGTHASSEETEKANKDLFEKIKQKSPGLYDNIKYQDGRLIDLAKPTKGLSEKVLQLYNRYKQNSVGLWSDQKKLCVEAMDDAKSYFEELERKEWEKVCLEFQKNLQIEGIATANQEFENQLQTCKEDKQSIEKELEELKSQKTILETQRQDLMNEKETLENQLKKQKEKSYNAQTIGGFSFIAFFLGAGALKGVTYFLEPSDELKVEDGKQEKKENNALLL